MGHNSLERSRLRRKLYFFDDEFSVTVTVKAK